MSGQTRCPAHHSSCVVRHEATAPSWLSGRDGQIDGPAGKRPRETTLAADSSSLPPQLRASKNPRNSDPEYRAQPTHTRANDVTDCSARVDLVRTTHAACAYISTAPGKFVAAAHVWKRQGKGAHNPTTGQAPTHPTRGGKKPSSLTKFHSSFSSPSPPHPYARPQNAAKKKNLPCGAAGLAGRVMPTSLGGAGCSSWRWQSCAWSG